MNLPIFKLLSLIWIYLSLCTVNAAEIDDIYKKNKNKLKDGQVMNIQSFLFASSFSKATTENIDYEKNKLRCYSYLLDYFGSNISWPKKISKNLQKELWSFYIKEKHFTLKNSKVVDFGLVGDNYYVVVGVSKDNIEPKRPTFEDIINLLQ